MTAVTVGGDSALAPGALDGLRAAVPGFNDAADDATVQDTGADAGTDAGADAATDAHVDAGPSTPDGSTVIVLPAMAGGAR
jgi:hypothetical protein